MASRVEFAVSCTPICTVAAGENVAVDTLAADVAKSLGASGNVTVTWGTTIGYAAGVPTYVLATTATSLGTFTSVKFVYIRNTGYTDAAQATVTTSTLTVLVSANAIAVLGAGQAMILPYASATTPTITATSSSGTVAVEVMATA